MTFHKVKFKEADLIELGITIQTMCLLDSPIELFHFGYRGHNPQIYLAQNHFHP